MAQCTYYDYETDQECTEEGEFRPLGDNRILCEYHYIKFLPKLLEQLKTYKPDKSDLFCGIHSNIPLCCCMFYDVYHRLRDKIPELRQGVCWYDLGEKKKGVHYIACPACIYRMEKERQKPNKVKKCDCVNIDVVMYPAAENIYFSRYNGIGYDHEGAC